MKDQEREESCELTERGIDERGKSKTDRQRHG